MIFQRQVIPVADHLIGHLAEPAFDQLCLFLMISQRARLGELQAYIGRSHASQGPFAHGLAGVVEVLGHQRIGLGPGGQPVQGAFQLLGTAVAHELHHLFADAALDPGDVGSGIAEGLLRFHVQRCTGLVGALVFATKLQGASVGRRYRLTAVIRTARLEFFDRCEVTLWRTQRGRGLRCSGEYRQSQQRRRQQRFQRSGARGSSHETRPHCPI